MNILEVEKYTMVNNGGVAALKGYRVQALYTIHSILTDTAAQTYVPEGREDLDILGHDGTVSDYVQIKNYSEPLSLSQIISTTGTSFLQRCLEKIKRGDRAKFTLVSFGTVGPELKKLFSIETSSEEFRKRLKYYSTDSRLLDTLKTRVKIVECNEKQIEQLTIDALKSTGLNADPNLTLELLHFWIYLLSEQRKSLSKQLLLKKIADIGKYETERGQYYSHFQISIRSFSDAVPTEEMKKKLRDQYYIGMGAHYQHIQCDSDVVRDNYLREVQSRFSATDALIIHGASGQGKSTLAYRYIHDYYSASLAFQVELSNDEQFTLSQIETLKGMAKSIDIPILLYLDVPPGNTSWVRFLKDFSISSSLKFLVTIREDDWSRAPGKDIEFKFEDIELKLTESEAREIYVKLNELRTDFVFTDFDEAWIQFGGNGPLLEFTYLVTQGQSLSARLKDQLQTITDSEAKEVLRIVAFADSLGAKIQVREMVSHFPRLQDIILLLEREFMIRSTDEGNSLIGLHPVRSTILSLHLVDNFSYHIRDYIIKCLKLIQESDIHTFLVNSLLQFQLQFDVIENDIFKFEPRTWSGRNGILQALLWKGVADYVKRNEETFTSAYLLLADAWYLGIRMNFADTGIPRNFLESSGMKLTSDTADGLSSISEKQTPIEEIYVYAEQWLEKLDFSSLSIDSERQAIDFGEFAYWANKLKPNITIVFNQENLRERFEIYNLETISGFLLGASVVIQQSELKVYQNVFIEKLQRDYRVAQIELEQDTVKVHFLIDLIQDIEGRETNVHERTMRIIDLVRRAFPDLKTYGAQGYGHRIEGLSTNDETTKEISVNNLPLPNLIELNVRTINLFEFRYRPKTWRDYVDLVIERRRRNITVLKSFNEALLTFFKKNDLLALLGFVQTCNINELKASDILFPQQISDQTGTVSERSSDSRIKGASSQTMQIGKLKKYQKRYFDYSTALSTAISFALTSITDRFTQQDRKHNERLGLVNAQEAFERLGPFQTKFNGHFLKFCDSALLQSIIAQESQALKIFIGLLRSVYLEKTQFMSGGESKVALELSHTREDFEKKLKAHLKAIERSNDIKITLHRNEVENSTCIMVDVSDPLQILKSLDTVSKAVHSTIGNYDPLSTRGFMLNSNFPTFTIVPTVLGNLINKCGLEWPLYVFRVESFDGLKPLQWVPRDLPEWILNKMKNKFYPDVFPEFKLIENFMLHYSKLSTQVGQIEQSEVLLSENLNDKGVKIVESYIQASLERAQLSCDWITLFLSRHFNDYAELSHDDNSIDENEHAFATYVYQMRDLISARQYDEQVINIREWKQRLNSVPIMVNYIYYYAMKKEIFGMWRNEKTPLTLEI